MNSDPHFYQLFRKCPELVADLAPIDLAGRYHFSSRAYKRVERTYDGIFEPEDINFPSMVTEFQVLGNENTYPRLFLEMAGYQLEEPKRKVWGLLVFPSRSCDPRTMPWRKFASCEPEFRVVYLDEALRKLGEDHPLYAVFQPFLVDKVEVVEAKAQDWLGTIRNAPLETEKIICLEEIFLSWLTQRLSKYSKEEIRKMFGFDTPVEETRFYREVKQEGREEGRQVGREEKAKQAINAFEAQMKDLLEAGLITKTIYHERVSIFRAQLAGKHGEA
ncbi:MAG: DUF2887 domain-containing protein [Acidobacteriota bacterium]|nr:DUF2887 domain-containing protein [Acidobacteriota bacterium]